MLRFTIVLIALVLLAAPIDVVNGHMVFKKTISKKYPDMSVTCNACHVVKKPKTERNEFGKMFAKELKEKNISETFKAFKKEAIDERKEYEQETMIPEFTKALEIIKKKKPAGGEMTYDSLIKSGEISGISKKKDSKTDSGSGN